MIMEHFAAVKARLEAETALAGKVFDSARIDASGTLIRDTYVILFGGSPDILNDNRHMAPQVTDSRAEYTYTVRSVSVSADGARAAASHVINQLVGFTPTVSGRKCERIRLDAVAGGAPKTDGSVKPPLYYSEDDFILVSGRA